MRHCHLVGVKYLLGPRGGAGEGDDCMGAGRLDGYGLGRSLTGCLGGGSLSTIVGLG